MHPPAPLGMPLTMLPSAPFSLPLSPPLTKLPPPVPLRMLPNRPPPGSSAAPLMTAAAAAAGDEGPSSAEGASLAKTSQPSVRPLSMKLGHGTSPSPAADVTEPACPEWRGAALLGEIGKNEGKSTALRPMSSECGTSSSWQRCQAVAAASSTSSVVKSDRGAWGAAAHGPSEKVDPAWG